MNGLTAERPPVRRLVAVSLALWLVAVGSFVLFLSIRPADCGPIADAGDVSSVRASAGWRVESISRTCRMQSGVVVDDGTVALSAGQWAAAAILLAWPLATGLAGFIGSRRRARMVADFTPTPWTESVRSDAAATPVAETV